jgi:hypothetical protein
MHRAFNSSGWVKDTPNKWTATVRAAILYGVDGSFQVEERNFRIVNLHKLAFPWGNLLKLARFYPLCRVHLGNIAPEFHYL